MGLIELIILILFLLGLIVVIGAAMMCRGQASMGSSEIPVNGVIHVRVSAITCRSFSVQFETVNPVNEVSGTINLTAEIAQTITASYASPQTQHELTFSNGSYGLARDTWYAYKIMGRGDFDHDPGTDITSPFVAKTANAAGKAIAVFVCYLEGERGKSSSSAAVSYHEPPHRRSLPAAGRPAKSAGFRNRGSTSPAVNINSNVADVEDGAASDSAKALTRLVQIIVSQPEA